MKDVPKVRQNGKCYVCKGERPFNPQKGVPWEAYSKDPFCSAACARTYFGTSIVQPPGPPKKSYFGR